MPTPKRSSQTANLAQQARAALQLMPVEVPEDSLQFETEGPTLDGTGRTRYRVDLEKAIATVEGTRYSIPKLYADLFGLSEKEAREDVLNELEAIADGTASDPGTPPTDTPASTGDTSPDAYADLFGTPAIAADTPDASTDADGTNPEAVEGTAEGTASDPGTPDTSPKPAPQPDVQSTDAPADTDVSADAPDDSEESPEPDWDALKEETEQQQIRERLRKAEEDKGKLRAALLRNGISPEEALRADANAAPEFDERLGWHSDPEPLSGCEHFPDAVFSDLPAPLHEATHFFDAAHKRDVFLMAALGRLSAVLPNVVGYWGDDVPKPHAPNLYTAIVAGASGGKGAAGLTHSLTKPVHKAMREESNKAQEDWQKRKRNANETDDPFDEPKPPGQYLHIPMNVSASKLIDMLVANGERGLLTTSEIDTLNDTLGQDWGAISPTLRQAYHHECEGGKARSGDGVQQLDEPHLSLVMVGTDYQFERLIRSPEDGLFSRISLYYFDAASPYRSQQPSREGIERRNRLEGMGCRILDLWQVLRGRAEPLQFKPKQRHWNAINERFDPLHYEVQARGFGKLLSIARRVGLWSFRIAMTLAVLRAHAEGASLRSIDTLTPADADVSAALDIASTCADHSLRFARAKLNAAEPASPKDNRIALMLKNVGNTFSYQEAYAAAKGEGIDASERTLRRDLNTAADRGLINSLGKQSGWTKAR